MHVRVSFWFIALAIAVGLVLRITLPSNVGLTVYFLKLPRFVPANVIALWLALAVVLVFIIAKLMVALLWR